MKVTMQEFVAMVTKDIVRKDAAVKGLDINIDEVAQKLLDGFMAGLDDTWEYLINQSGAILDITQEWLDSLIDLIKAEDTVAAKQLIVAALDDASLTSQGELVASEAETLANENNERKEKISSMLTNGLGSLVSGIFSALG